MSLRVVGLLMAVDVIPDMIFTALNATGYLAAAAIVARRSGSVLNART